MQHNQPLRFFVVCNVTVPFPQSAMSLSSSDQKTETELSHAVDEETSSPYSSADSPHSPPGSARPHTTAASLIADPLVQAALAEMQRRQDKELEEQRTAMAQVLAHNEQLLARVRTLESAPATLGADSSPPFADRTPLPTSYSLTGINPALLATPATVRLQPFSQPLPGSSAAAAVPHVSIGNPSVARGLFANPSMMAAGAPPPPPRPYNDEEKGWDKWVQDVRRLSRSSRSRVAQTMNAAMFVRGLHHSACN